MSKYILCLLLVLSTSSMAQAGWWSDFRDHHLKTIIIDGVIHVIRA